MATKVKALSRIAGSYGLANPGDELEVSASEAKDLEKAGLVKVVGDTSSDDKAEGFASSNLTAGKGNLSGGVRITDETNKSAKTVTQSVPAKSAPVKEEKQAAPKKAAAKKTGK